MPEVLAGFAEHAALLKQRKREREERQREWKEAEGRHLREEAFCGREKRRMLFVDAIHEQIVLRAKLLAVLDHLEKSPKAEATQVEDLMDWLRARIRQVDALISPPFLDVSERFAKIEFDEDRIEPGTDNRWNCYADVVELLFWAIDEKEGIARSRTAREWALETGEASESIETDAEPINPVSSSTNDP